jgi:WD40 repeat protein
MYAPRFSRIIGIFLLVCILIPAGQAIDPLWTVPASSGVELSAVAISHDGSTIVAGGDQLMVLTPDGKKLWYGWSGTLLDQSRDGGYIVTSQGQTVRLFTRQGIMLWDRSLGGTVTGISISPGAEIIAAGGGRTVQSWYNSGSGLGWNTTETVHDIKISPVQDQIIVSTAKALRSFNMSYVPNWYDDSISPGTVQISADGTGIVIPNGNHIRMYHGSGTLLWDRQFSGGNIISLAYSNDGATIVAGRDDGSVIVVDRGGNLLFTGNAGYLVESVSVSDDGSTIATGSIDNQVRVFDRMGTLLGSYQTKNPVKSRSVAVSGDGSLIVAVDISNVYGFSRDQLIVPAASPVTGGIRNESTGDVPGNTTVFPTISDLASSPPIPTTTTIPVTGTTPAVGLPWICSLAALTLCIVARKK